MTSALALARQGRHVIVLERAERLEETGAGLQLSPNAGRVLTSLGLRDAIASRAVAPVAVDITTTALGRVARIPLHTDDSAGAPYWVIHRADLQSALLDHVAQSSLIDLRLGCTVETFDAAGDGLNVHVQHGGARQSIAGAALIGADGVWSAVRQHHFPDFKPNFTGSIAWRGAVATDQLTGWTASDHVQLWMGANAHVVTYPMSGGQRINVVAILTGDWKDAGWSAPGERADILRRFSAPWSPDLRRLIETVPEWKRWALFTMPAGHEWARGPVALLGDAAHAMLPFAAQGAGMAIEDAAVLAQCIGRVDDANLAAALARYAKLRQPRVTRVQNAARQSGWIYHLDGPMAYARDIAMKALGPRLLQARQNWIYDWRV